MRKVIKFMIKILQRWIECIENGFGPGQTFKEFVLGFLCWLLAPITFFSLVIISSLIWEPLGIGLMFFFVLLLLIGFAGP